jgi:hypothetical protein
MGYEMTKTTPLKAIKLKCRECSGNVKEVELCCVPECPLYAFRTGRKVKWGISGPSDKIAEKSATFPL